MISPLQYKVRHAANRTLQLCLLLFVLLGGVVAQARTETADTGKLWVTADFNGDNKTDLVTVTTSVADGYYATASHTLRPGPVAAAAFGLPQILPMHRLRARDIDGDNDADLVLETLSSEPVAVWLNDGDGNFKRANLDDFRFQLSHQTPYTMSAAEDVPLPDVLDDAPGTDLDALAPASLEAPVARQYVYSFQTLPRTTFRLSPSTRGPPQNS